MYEYNAEVTNVVDGDTFDATLDLGFGASLKVRLRVLRINAPEMHGASAAAGAAALEYARSLLSSGPVVVTTHETDHFGRWLADVRLADGRDFGGAMVTAGHAVPYMPRLVATGVYEFED